MEKAIYRPSRPGDEPHLKEIWRLAYQDEPIYLETFFQQIYQPGMGIAAELDGILRSAIYLLDGFSYLVPGQKPQTCTYLYALGTPPSERGHGYGGRTIWHSGVEGYLRGVDLVCFLPASSSLARWYEDILGTRTAFWYRQFPVSEPSPLEGLSLSPLLPEEYGILRETLLADTPHVMQPVSALTLQNTFCQLGGGGLYRLTWQGKTAVAAFDREGDTLTLRELLAPAQDPVVLVKGLLHYVGGASASVRTPTFWHPELGERVDCSVLIPGGFSFRPSPDGYWGLALD